MKLQILYFASVREAVGVASEFIVVPDQVHTVAHLRHYLAQRGGDWAQAFVSAQPICAAVNQQWAMDDTSLAQATEVAFFPPVTGG